MSDTLAMFVNLLFTVLTFAIFARVLMSWISPTGNDPVSPILYDITEPVLKPIRSVVPALGMFDLTPMIALVVLNVIRPVLVNLLTAG